MLLPNQAPPVDRQRIDQRETDDHDVEPQVICRCRQNNDGSRTVWCLIGKDFVNTGYPC